MVFLLLSTFISPPIKAFDKDPNEQQGGYQQGRQAPEICTES
jgi:hypothetical protein